MQFESVLPDGGLSPFSILSKVMNPNMNADYLDGYHASAFLLDSAFNTRFDGRFAIKTTDNLAEGVTNKYFTEARVRATPLTGYVIGANTAVLATDTIPAAIGKLEAKINATGFSGTLNYLAKYTSTGLWIGLAYDNGTAFGIGVGASPGSRLHVSGTESATGTNATFQLTNTAATGGNSWYISAGGPGYSGVFNGGLWIGDNSNFRFSIGANGRVGINLGAAAPSEMLHVGGNIRATGQLISNQVTGTAPLSVASTTFVPNLNVNYINGRDEAYLLSRVNHTGIQSLTAGSGLLGTAYNGLNAYTWSIDFGTGSTQVAAGNHVHANHTPGTGITGSIYTGAAAQTWSVTYGITAGTAAEGNHTHTFASLTSKPTTLSGYGITDAVSLTYANANYFPAAVSVSDFNTPTGDRWLAAANGSPANQPVGGNFGSGWQVSATNNPDYINQLVFTYVGALNTRTKFNGVWGSWDRVTTDSRLATLTRGTGLTGSNFTPLSAATWAIDFGTSSTQVAAGNHTHANLTPGTGLSGSVYTGAAAQTWTLATSGVVAGTGTKFVVDTYGRITSRVTATTLADYGITDAIGTGSISGTTNRLAVFTSGSAIGASTVTMSGSNMSVAGGLTAGGSITMDYPSVAGGIGFVFSTSGSPRFYFSRYGSEAGGNSGSNLSLYALNDAGSGIGDVFRVIRNTRQMEFDVSPSVPSPSSGNDAANKSYVDGKTWAFSAITGRPTNLSGYGITDAYPLSGNPSGFITGINSGMVTTALGYTPYNSSNPSNYITGINSGMVIAALGYTPGSGSGTIGGGGASGYMAVFQSGGASITNSRLYDTGSGRIQTMSGAGFQSAGDILSGGNIDCGIYTFIGNKATVNVAEFANSLVVGGSSISSALILEVRSSTKGSLPYPKMSRASRLSMGTPSEVMFVFQTDTVGASAAGLKYWDHPRSTWTHVNYNDAAA